MQIHRTHADTSPFAIEGILGFWLGEPAPDSASLVSKFQRWYQGGEPVDRAIRASFAPLIESALAGELDDWKSSPRGALALVLLLDQFTRNVFRGTPRAYAGDRAALELALPMVDTPAYRALTLEERLFWSMPLVHSENLEHLTRAVELARDLVADAPPALREPWKLGYERVQHYRWVISRFGRFPHRNEILGRPSTPQELAFLAEEAGRAPVLPARDEPARAGGEAGP